MAASRAELLAISCTRGERTTAGVLGISAGAIKKKGGIADSTETRAKLSQNGILNLVHSRESFRSRARA